jgi:DNA-binding CsgD family transcriptional regulator
MRTRDAALIRKLCSLGLPPQFLVQSLLPALREIIPAHSGGVFWVDADAQMTALYAERLLEPEVMAAYYERHYKDAVEGFAAAFCRRARDDDPVSTHSLSPTEQCTDYFREILRSLDAYHILYAILTHQGEAYAQLSLYRGASDEPFDSDDQHALRGVLRYVSEGLFDPGRNPLEADESVVVEESLGVVSASGEIVSATDQWRRLVRLAALAHVNPSQASQESRTIASFVRELSRPGPQRGLSGPEEVVRQTAWGRFVIRKFALRGATVDDEQIGLLIRREEPRTLSLIRGAGHSLLSPQQREVALLLAQGKTNPEIAQALSLSLNTASYHVKQVYSRLDVSDRGAVQQQLLRLAGDEFESSHAPR